MSLPEACEAERYAEVALVPAVPGKNLLTYRVPAPYRARICVGMRVLVPLGRRRETGVVVALHGGAPPDIALIRDIEEPLDSEPILTEPVFALCRWTARYYLTTLADVLATALPGGLRASGTRVVRLVDDDRETRGPRGPLEAALVERLRIIGAATTHQLARALGRPGVTGALNALAARGIVTIEDRLRQPAGKTAWARVLVLTQELVSSELALLTRRAPRQRALYTKLATSPRSRLAVASLTASERAAAAALVRRGMAGWTREERYRDGRPPIPSATPQLVPNAEQRAAVESVTTHVGFRVFVLHGVTGSGKTEVYLQLAEQTRAAGRSVLMLVPEIALTHQLILQAQQRFGPSVALLHSGLSPGERWDEWRRVARGEARVAIGTRSAVFAPLADLGLVIVDEEHDAAYKQEEGLRYNARDLAVVRAKLAGVSVVLGSATPAVETYQQALDGKFELLTLRSRVEGRPLPDIQLVDMRVSARSSAHRAPAPTAFDPNRGTDTSPSTREQTALFSPPLLDAIQQTLERGEQTLLFLNRRGFAKTLQCLACGEPVGCPSCSVTLTLHRGRDVLLCHHCGHAQPGDSPCSACGSRDLHAFGAGTEHLEAEIRRLFPGARVARLDRDTTGRKGAHQRILDAWRAGATDILIGTQMVTKGHDVPGVTLVGVLLADVALNMPDFRAAERAFQLLTQVAGRAGRGPAPGTVVVQTYRPTHHSLVAAAAHDYASFVPKELALRRELGYPPFSRLAVLRFEGPDPAATERAASELAARAHSAAADGAVTLRGPAPAPLERLRGRYRWQLLLSSSSVTALHSLVRRVLAAWGRRPEARAIRLVVDVDPASML